MTQIACPETSETNYQSVVRIIPEEPRFFFNTAAAA